MTNKCYLTFAKLSINSKTWVQFTKSSYLIQKIALNSLEVVIQFQKNAFNALKFIIQENGFNSPKVSIRKKCSFAKNVHSQKVFIQFPENCHSKKCVQFTRSCHSITKSCHLIQKHGYNSPGAFIQFKKMCSIQ